MRSYFSLLIILLLSGFSSCEKASNYRFLGIEDSDTDDPLPEDPGVSMDHYPADGSLAFHENFQSWKRDGYINQVQQGCETDLMTTSVIMYQPDRPVTVTYAGFAVTYALQDYAVNPVCGNKAGTSTAGSEISTGYVALQSEIYYECGGHNSDAQLNLSKLPSVSKISFGISYGGDVEFVGGISLWVKEDGESGFTRIGDYGAESPSEGQVFTVDIDKKNVFLRFTPAISDRGIGVNDGEQSDRSVRLHDLYIWSMNETE